VNELEKLGIFSVDCREAGLTESESLEQVRHLIHQWKTPFRAPYSGGSSFTQLIQLRQALKRAVEKAHSAQEQPAPKTAPDAPAAKSAALEPAPPPPVKVATPAPPAKPVAPAPAAAPPQIKPILTAVPVAEPSPASQSEVTAEALEEEEDYLQRCQADIAEQLAAVPQKHTPAVSTIHLAGCKLMIATWEAEAFRGTGEPSGTLQRAVAARTILHVCIDRKKKNEATDLAAALEIAQRQVDEMKIHVERAKKASNIDAAVNLAATAKRLLALVEEGRKLSA
jgi:hypothetical protein